ncbi:hypothetical protein ACQ4PT_065773 [Festuca glaucescens]
MPEAPMRSRRRRLSQHAHWLSQEEIAYYDDSESKSISREPTTANEEEDDDEEEEEKEDEEEDEEEEEEEEDDDDEELAPESSMEQEKELFDRHRQNWEFTFSHPGLTFDVFTSLSSMVFTHCTPSCIPPEAVLARTLQVCSIKVSKIKHLKWPLDVYGLVSARDYVDHKRNILFYRPRSQSQTLTKNDPYLHLTGPRRGLLSIDPVHIEIQLRLKQGQSRSEDRALVTQAFRYDNPSNCDWFHSYLSNYLCQIELCLEQLTRSRQATVLSVRVTRGSPFRYGGQILCCASPYEDDPCKMIVLFDSKYGKTTTLDSDGTMSMDPDGYLDLSRRVVSVQGRLKIFINTYSRSGAISASGRVSFRAKDCQTSQAKCFLHKRSKASKGNSAASEGKDEVKINVAWSRFARKISAIELDCFGDL